MKTLWRILLWLNNINVFEHLSSFDINDILTFYITDEDGKIHHKIEYPNGHTEEYIEDWTKYNNHKFKVFDKFISYTINGEQFMTICVDDITTNTDSFKITKQVAPFFRKVHNNKPAI